MAEGFETWVSSLASGDPSDLIVATPGAVEFLREMFDERGPVAAEVIALAAQERQIQLARSAVELLGADLRATTELQAPPFEHRIEDGAVRVAYWGRYAPSTIMTITGPEVVAEVSDFMQDEIVEGLHAAWPVCPDHHFGAYVQIAGGQAVWNCRSQQHVIAVVGRLAR
jgi:hypothetical protein